MTAASPRHVIQSMNDCPAESVPSVVLNRCENWYARLELLQNLPGPVAAAVVHHDNFVRDVMKPQFKIEVLDGGGNTPFLIARRDDDAETSEFRVVRVRRHEIGVSLCTGDQPVVNSNQFGCLSA